ncbi:hypothetical protein [Algibacillus agarilyticus]|uniref:hypothetical protein n=1 Tax=Algibacillus agarilyticus TaxID=2234133 RepID=UPI000DCFB7BE|nr:hypothetical protein [Algibacillus agarilyticus]
MLHIKLRFCVSLLAVWLLLQVAYGVGAYKNHQQLIELASHSVENRVALDLDQIQIANSAMSIAGEPKRVRRYIEKLNMSLQQALLPVTLVGLQGVYLAEFENTQLIERILVAPQQDIVLVLRSHRAEFSHYISIYPLLFALFIVFLSQNYIRFWNLVGRDISTENKIKDIPAVLTLDLKQKTLLFSKTQTCVDMANKPLCFYAALLEFCASDKSVVVSHNRDVPEPLFDLANKYFYRLIELGHTVRKRPNFNNNQEKTLSEIRSVLDDVFGDDLDAKALYYPPKAHGEGSRSKLHHYGLANIEPIHFTIVGK